VVRILGAPRRRRRRRRRAAPVGEADSPDVPLTRVTVVTPLALGSADEAGLWLERTSGDAEAAAGLRAAALGLVNRAIHIQRAASGNPYLHEVAERSALAARVGYGSGENVADGRWDDARELAPEKERGSRSDELTPQQRVAAVLGGKDAVDACETLVLRARIDLDNGRPREAALQIRVGAEALLAELAGARTAGQPEDLAVLDALRQQVGAAANAAIGGEPSEQLQETVREAIEVSERILRRRRLRDG
jgi:hypothetical protein